MHTAGQDRIGRRQFVKAAGLAASLGIAGGAQQGVSIVADPADAVAVDSVSRWAAKTVSIAGAAARSANGISGMSLTDFPFRPGLSIFHRRNLNPPYDQSRIGSADASAIPGPGGWLRVR